MTTEDCDRRPSKNNYRDCKKTRFPLPEPLVPRRGNVTVVRTLNVLSSVGKTGTEITNV